MRMKAFARVTCATAVVVILASGSSVLLMKLRAQQATGRIVGAIDNAARTTITGTRPPLARRVKDAGPVAPDMPLQGMSIVFTRSAAQEADLQALIAAQQNPASPLYHHWLTPDEFAARFGMDDSDIAKVQTWLQQQGFSIDGISRSRNRITFSGTAGQVQAAFGTELHYYNVNGRTHFAPSSDVSVPSALAPVVQDVTNLSTFRPKPRLKRPKPNFTSSVSGHTYLSPKDVATIYDVNAAYNAGFTGKGQSIAVIGQTSVSLTDIENFQNAAGLTIKDPTLVLVPNSGNVAEFQGDESESDLDLQYSGGMAPGATIYFVYVGDSPNATVFSGSLQYAIENDIAPIISDSYGLCETSLGQAGYNSLNALLAQGAAQGQSLIVPAGDSGSPDCAGTSNLSTTQQQALAVDFPASSQYVTAMGGSEFPSSVVCNLNCSSPPSQYWQAASGTDVISSALSSGVPFPEQAWNDDSPPDNTTNPPTPATLSSGGGGQSALTSRPTWQATLPAGSGSFGSMRLVPDIALSASPNNAGYLYCTSDTSAWDTANGQVASCNSGFRDSSSSLLTLAGGTSFDAPIFAGLVAIINEKENSVGQGVVSSTLYQLAANSTTYKSAFHDITSGNNNCSAAGSTVCSGSAMTQYSAGTGYDLATGLGSIDFNNLLAAWPAQPGSTLKASTTTVSAATNPPVVGTGDTITINVAPSSGSGTPSGTVQLWISAATEGGTPTTQTLNLTSGSTTYNFVSSAAAPYVVRAIYSGDSTFAASTSTLALGNQSFRLTATSPTITPPSAASSTITITPQEGYTGSISWAITSSPAFTNGCYSLSNATVSSPTTPVTATLTIDTSTATCGGAAMIQGPAKSGSAIVAAGPSKTPQHRAPFGLGIGALLFAGVLASGSRKSRVVASMALIAALALVLPACGGGGSSTSNKSAGSNVPAGTYTLKVVGTDTSSSTISGTTSVTVVVN